MTEPPKERSLSLWLVPPEDSDLYKAIHELILMGIPSVYPIALPPEFTPHVTLTANTISADSSPSQRWLDKLEFPNTSGLKMKIYDEAQVGDIFFQKLTMRCEKTPELCKLAAYGRGAGLVDMSGAKEWVENNYGPHCSLMYSDLPLDEVRSKLEEVNDRIQSARHGHPGCTTAKDAEIWLVETFKDIDDWQPVARRKLPDVEWSWGRNDVP